MPKGLAVVPEGVAKGFDRVAEAVAKGLTYGVAVGGTMGGGAEVIVGVTEVVPLLFTVNLKYKNEPVKPSTTIIKRSVINMKGSFFPPFGGAVATVIGTFSEGGGVSAGGSDDRSEVRSEDGGGV